MRDLVAGCRLAVAIAFAPLGLAMAQGSGNAGAATDPQAYLEQHCLGCHNQEASTAMALFSGLFLDRLDVHDVARDAATWEEVLRKLHTGMMPPASEPRPDPEANAAFIAYLESELDRAAAARPNPGRPALHRLNRTEYANAIRDLLGIEVDTRALLPADDSSHGFDNVAASLSISPMLIERFTAAAAKISRLAVGSSDIAPERHTFYVAPFLSQTSHFEGFPFGSRGGLRVEYYFPRDAEYVVDVDLMRSGETTVMGASIPNEQLEVSVDGERVALFDISRPPPPMPPQPGDEEYEEEAPAREPGDSDVGETEPRPRERGEELRWQVRLPLTAGPHTILATFVKRNHAPVEDLLQQSGNVLLDPPLTTRPEVTLLPHVSTISISGPYDVTGPGATPSRERIFVCRPQRAEQEAACAREILTALAHRAYRHPPSTEHLSTLLEFYEEGRREGGFERGIEVGLQRILASPQFIFRFERDPAEADAPYRISDTELASRLAFFLWSSIPDDELLDLASRNRLRRPAVLEQQVRRMLADPRAVALTENFAGQWLHLRNLAIKDASVALYPDFDDVLRHAFRRETELFFDHLVRQDASVLELLTADYTFVNERLAKHYGMPGVYGSHFRMVPVTDEQRRGILGHGSILLVTSQPNRTSPVTRGVWILENILGAHVPTPPLEVPALEEASADFESMSVRELMALHNARPFCGGCHAIMDPVGLAMENFDVIGRWRSHDKDGPIDASGRLVDGTVVDGPAELRAALLKYSDQVVRNMTEKLLVYALGRGLEHYDQPVVRAIARRAADANYRFSSIVTGIVSSDAFQMRAPESLLETAVAAEGH